VVSKKKPHADILACIEQTGHLDYGENYVQELRQKAEWFAENAPHLDICWHFIGQLQTNNLAAIAKHASVIQTLCKPKHALKLDALGKRYDKVISVYLQLKSDPSKPSGVSPAELLELASAVGELPNLCLRGVMVFPAASFQDQQSEDRPPIAYQVFRSFANKVGEQKLSLGTSGDLAMAISAGSDMVRVGRAILGER